MDTLYYIYGSVGHSQINAQINSGISLWCYRGWLGMSSYDPSASNNGRRLPFATAITCGTNDFDGSDVCETFLKTGSISTPKGCIGIIGMSSSNTHTKYNNIITGGAIQGLMRESIFNSGAVLNRSRLELYRNYPTDSATVANFCHYATLLGDPAVNLFTGTPDTLYVNNPSSLPVGTNTLTLSVRNEHGQAVEEAYVCLATGRGVLAGNWTDTYGQVTFNFTTTSAESLFVTASKHNCRPAINYTLITTSTRFVSPPSLNFVLDDDNNGESSGNGDGLANPGETIELAVPLKNWGTSTAMGVSAVLSVTDPFIATIGDNYEFYGDIVSGQTVLPADDFGFTVASYAPDGHVVQFTLTVTDNVPNTWVSAVPISLSNGNLEFFRYSLTGVGDGILDPGESCQMWLRLANIGTRSTADAIVGYLRTTDPALTITDSVGTFTASNPGGDCNNELDPFGVSATICTVPGDRIPMTIIFPLTYGFADTIPFILNIGTVASTTPTPPDSYGYRAFDNTDVTYGKRPTYSWVEIDDRYGGAGTPLSIIDNADEDDETVVVNLPFTFKYYGQNFTQISVCSNGWLAMGANQAVHETFRNWTIPGALGPSAMIAPFWDDLRVTYTGSGGRVYTYHDAANHRFIIQWSRVQKYGGSNPIETFQCILYQPGYPATPTGDGEILFQYNTCVNTYDVSTSNDFATAGIENLTETDGVLFNYFNIPAPGATSLTSGRAILFTTQRVPPTTPKTPTNLTSVLSGNDIRLRWNAVREDILNQPITVSQYKIYRDTTPYFAPGGGNYLGAASDTTYLDVGAVSGSNCFYVVQAYTGALSRDGDSTGEPATSSPSAISPTLKRER
ncbi:MAG: C25 family cysteine peptidase [bacterium]